MQSVTDEDTVLAAFVALGGRADGGQVGFAPAPQREVRCLFGTPHRPVLVRIAGGRIVELSATPGILKDYHFAYQAPAATWLEFWQPMPRPGWHDLFALVKRGEASLFGDMHPFMAHLQYFKDLLTLPRGRVGGVA